MNEWQVEWSGSGIFLFSLKCVGSWETCYPPFFKYSVSLSNKCSNRQEGCEGKISGFCMIDFYGKCAMEKPLLTIITLYTVFLFVTFSLEASKICFIILNSIKC